jgi:hypothetical protein
VRLPFDIYLMDRVGLEEEGGGGGGGVEEEEWCLSDEVKESSCLAGCNIHLSGFNEADLKVTYQYKYTHIYICFLQAYVSCYIVRDVCFLPASPLRLKNKK